MYYYLFLLLAEAWVVPHPLQIFRGFGGGGSFPFFPGYATEWRWRYLNVHNLSNCICLVLESSLLYSKFLQWIAVNFSFRRNHKRNRESAFNLAIFSFPIVSSANSLHAMTMAFSVPRFLYCALICPRPPLYNVP